MKLHLFLLRNAKIIVIIIILFLLALTFVARIYNSYHSSNFDEQISVRVLERMYSTGDLDPNWALADLPPYFKYNQYSFSSYHYASFIYYSAIRFVADHFISAPMQIHLDEGYQLNIPLNYDYRVDLGILRSFSIILGTLGGIFVFLIARRAWNTKVALLSLLLYSLAPILVQDSHYARPESFITFLTLVVIYLSINNNKLKLLPLFFSMFLFGILIACKITMFLLLPIALYPVVDHFYMIRKNLIQQFVENKHRYIWLFVTIIGSGVLGIFLGMPHALLNTGAYFEGLKSLLNQYSGGHPPHSSFYQGDIFFSLRQTSFYFTQTLGFPIICAFLIGIIGLCKAQSFRYIILFILPILLFYGFFAFQKVFFERNFSQVVPLLLTVASFGCFYLFDFIRKYRLISLVNIFIAVIIVIGLNIIPAIQTYRIVVYAFGNQYSHDVKSYEEYLLKKYTNIEITNQELLTEDQYDSMEKLLLMEQNKIVFKVYDYNDDFTKYYVSKAINDLRVQKIGEYRGPFKDVVTCTLHTYLAPNFIYLHGESAK